MTAPAPLSPYGITPLTPRLWELGGRGAYAAGIASGHASFADTAPGWADFAASRLPDHLHAAVATDGTCLGWSAASPAFNRCVYSGVVEGSVYVDPLAAGRGIGEALLRALVEGTERAGIWTIEALIFPENAGSLRLHRRLGFREVGLRERMGFMTHGPLAGRWRDVVLLERRSQVAGA